MSDIIDINVGETIEEVTINVVDNLITVNINKVTGGGGGTQTLAETLALGNVTGGENISISNGDAIVLDNGSMLKKGTIDAGNGGAKGISQICGVGYEHKWEAGRLYIMNDGGTIIREVSHNLTYTPTATDDVTKGFVQNTRWILDNGDVYLCTDPTEGAAVWELVNTGTTPTLQQVTDEGNVTGNSIIVTDNSENETALQYNGINFNDLDEGGNTLLRFLNTSAASQEIEIRGLSGTMALTSDIPDTSTLVPYQLGGGVSKSINLFDEVGNVGSLKLPDNLTQDRLLLFQDKDYTGIADITDIPDTSTLVPYTGATTDVDLGEFELKAGQVTLDTTPTGTAAVATTRWNDANGTSQTTLKGGNVILKNGIDLVARVVNKVNPNTTLTKAAYQVVRVSGAQGQRLAVELAQANTDNNSADTLGIVTETIATNQEGFIITVGQLENINTTGSLQGETWTDGDVLYLSPTTAGRITNIKPNGSTGHIVVLGYVEYAHANNGKIYVKIMNGWELDELHNVFIDTPLNNQGLVYETSTDLWKNKTIDKTLVGLANVDNTSDANKPVSTATQTALNLRQRKLFNLTPQVTHTGTVTKTIIATYYIPANTFTAGDFLNFSAIISKTSGASTTHNLEINTTNTLTGATIISTVGFGTTNATMKFKREIVLNGGTAFVLNVSTGTPNDNVVGVNVTALSQYTYNLAADLYFFVTCTLTLTSDNIIYRGIQITD